MKHGKPAIGLWGAPCCIEDMQQITDDDDLEFATEGMPCWSFGFYDTEQELVDAFKETAT